MIDYLYPLPNPYSHNLWYRKRGQVNYETPTILSRIGKAKMKSGRALDTSGYGRKESEGKDFNEDTNFGKLKRIPHPALQAFLWKHRLR